MYTQTPAAISGSKPALIVAAAVIGACVVGAWLLVGAIAQDPAYHLFADRRSLMAIPNAHNVLSNLPFCLAGLLGICSVAARRGRLRGYAGMYLVFFSAVFLTAFGSGYYHLNPNNLSLVWDRLPMAVAFMSILAIVISERLDPGLGRALFPWLLISGIGSVLYWHGLDDLRPYALVQFGSLLALLVLLLLHRRPGSGLLWLALAFYGLAKVLETADAQVFALSGHLVSGHALKHLAAAIAPLLILQRLVGATDRDDTYPPSPQPAIDGQEAQS